MSAEELPAALLKRKACAAYLPEKRAALERWGEHLRAIVEGREQTVVALAKAAG